MDKMMKTFHSVTSSPYLARPLRTLEQAQAEQNKNSPLHLDSSTEADPVSEKENLKKDIQSLQPKKKLQN
ncbi:hypothetical protein O4H49_12130 [Kiloniella laminariae]|uniref:Uncharacterized protein n=1 Tax=Kiloniella laminariae TaxID=454162 RepID=A0ABT4LKA8_9PROT|nr:hypothetical protein [Kiloniella laminariae]MCZ4281531.1 hypothetical protein [Kiloniella laminariae]